MSNFFVNSFFPYSIKQWDQLDPELRKEHDFAVFKTKLEETIKPSKFKHFNVGYKYPNQLHTQLRVGRSSLNSHLYPIGLSNTKSCPCGFANESVEHFLLDCIFYQNIRGQLYQKLGGLLEMKLSTYSKKDLVQIMLCGEKPHLPEKFYHNKSIFFSVQTFLLKTKRLIAYNKPRPLAPPPHESDWCTHCWCISLSANFQLLCLLILPNYKTQRFFPEVLSNRLNSFYTSSSHSIHPITHMLCVVCVCVCLS